MSLSTPFDALRPAVLRLLAVALSLLALATLAPATQSAPPSMQVVQRLIRNENWPKAIVALEKITAAQPTDAVGWFYLAYCHHNAGDLRKALEVGSKAAEFPELRATALYNMACAHSMLDELEPAAKCLGDSRAAGFTDYDLLETDPELANLRAAIELELPARHDYSELVGRNGVVIPYRVLLPEGYDAEREYSVAVFFAQAAGGKRSMDWCIDELWSERSTRSDWVVVCAVAPENGWINHPSHHALEDLFKRLRKDYRVASKRFHLVGLGSGARPAATYSRMSRAYTASLTVISASCFDGWDDGDFRSMKQVPVHQLVGGRAAHLTNSATVAEAGFEKHSVRSTLTVIEEDCVLLESLRGGSLLERVASGVLTEER